MTSLAHTRQALRQVPAAQAARRRPNIRPATAGHTALVVSNNSASPHYRNESHVRLGDPRLNSFARSSSFEEPIPRQRRRSDPYCGLGGLDPETCRRFDGLTVRERRASFERSMDVIGDQRTSQLEQDMRLKLDQRTSHNNCQQRTYFKYFDRDGNGGISLKEFSQGLEAMGFNQLEYRELLALFGKYDVDGNGQIDYNEFCNTLLEPNFSDVRNSAFGSRMRSFLHNQTAGSPTGEMETISAAEKQEQRREIRRIFDLIDRDGNQNIDRSEFERLTRELGARLSPRALDAAMDAIDRDASGVIEFEELCDWWFASTSSDL